MSLECKCDECNINLANIEEQLPRQEERRNEDR